MANKININQNQLYSTAGALDPRFIVDSVDKITSISNAYVGLEVSVIDSEGNTIEKYRIKKINNLTKKPLPANQGGYELIQEPKDLKYSDGVTPFLNNNGNIDADYLKFADIDGSEEEKSTEDDFNVKTDTLRIDGTTYENSKKQSIRNTIGAQENITSMQNVQPVIEALNNRTAKIDQQTSEIIALGYKVLNPNLSFAEQVNSANTIYEIKDSFDLEGGSVTIPTGSVLKFNGGKITNGTIDLNGGKVDAWKIKVFDNISIRNTDYIEASWFGVVGDGVTDNSDGFDKIVDWLNSTDGGYLKIPSGNYILKKKFQITRNCKIEGDECTLDFTQSTDTGYDISFAGTRQTLSSENIVQSSITKGSFSIDGSIEGLSVGDYIIIMDANNYSYSSARYYYTKGEIKKVTKIENNKISFGDELYDDYNQTDKLNLYKINPISVILSGIKVISQEGTGKAPVSITNSINCKLDRLNIWGGNEVNLALTYCIDSIVSNCKIDYNYTTGSGYGLSIGCSQNIKVEGGVFKTHRHGITIGNSGIVNRFISIYNSNVSSYRGDYGMDSHGASEYITVDNCILNAGINLNGDHLRIQNSEITGTTSCVYFGYELSGYDIVVQNCNITPGIASNDVCGVRLTSCPFVKNKKQNVIIRSCNIHTPNANNAYPFSTIAIQRKLIAWKTADENASYEVVYSLTTNNNLSGEDIYENEVLYDENFNIIGNAINVQKINGVISFTFDSITYTRDSSEDKNRYCKGGNVQIENCSIIADYLESKSLINYWDIVIRNSVFKNNFLQITISEGSNFLIENNIFNSFWRGLFFAGTCTTKESILTIKNNSFESTNSDYRVIDDGGKTDCSKLIINIERNRIKDGKFILRRKDAKVFFSENEISMSTNSALFSSDTSVKEIIYTNNNYKGIVPTAIPSSISTSTNNTFDSTDTPKILKVKGTQIFHTNHNIPLVYDGESWRDFLGHPATKIFRSYGERDFFHANILRRFDPSIIECSYSDDGITYTPYNMSDQTKLGLINNIDYYKGHTPGKHKYERIDIYPVKNVSGLGLTAKTLSWGCESGVLRRFSVKRMQGTTEAGTYATDLIFGKGIEPDSAIYEVPLNGAYINSSIFIRLESEYTGTESPVGSIYGIKLTTCGIKSELNNNVPASAKTQHIYDYDVNGNVTFPYGLTATALRGSSGTSANRPVLTSSQVGVIYFDTTLGKPIYWSSTAWVDANGDYIVDNNGTLQNRLALTSPVKGQQFKLTREGETDVYLIYRSYGWLKAADGTLWSDDTGTLNAMYDKYNYTLLTEQPSDWTTKYNTYYKIVNGVYILLTTLETWASDTYYKKDVNVNKGIQVKLTDTDAELRNKVVKWNGTKYINIVDNVALKAGVPQITFTTENNNTTATITSTSSGKIYYTKNGDAPTSSSTEYNSAITLAEGDQVKAICIRDHVDNSNIGFVKVATPVIEFSSAGILTITCNTPDVKIYYTIDGSTPTTSSTEYDSSASVTIAKNVTVKAFAVLIGRVNSEIVSKKRS